MMPMINDHTSAVNISEYVIILKSAVQGITWNCGTSRQKGFCRKSRIRHHHPQMDFVIQHLCLEV